MAVDGRSSGGFRLKEAKWKAPRSSDGNKAYLALAGLASSIWQTLGCPGHGPRTFISYISAFNEFHLPTDKSNQLNKTRFQ